MRQHQHQAQEGDVTMNDITAQFRGGMNRVTTPDLEDDRRMEEMLFHFWGGMIRVGALAEQTQMPMPENQRLNRGPTYMRIARELWKIYEDPMRQRVRDPPEVPRYDGLQGRMWRLKPVANDVTRRCKRGDIVVNRKIIEVVGKTWL